MHEALPYIQKHEYHPVLFPVLLRSLTRYINVHSNSGTGDPSKGVVSHSKSAPLIKRQGRRHSMQGATPTSDVASIPAVSAPRKVANEPGPPPAFAGKKPRQRRHSMLSTVVPVGVGGHPKKPQSEFDGYPLPPNKVHRPKEEAKPESSDDDDRPVVTASPMRRRRRHSISVPSAPSMPPPASPRRIASPQRQPQNLRIMPASLRQMPQSPVLDVTSTTSTIQGGVGGIGTETQYEDQMEIRVARRKLEQARQNLAVSQESFERLKQSQEETREQQLLSFSNHGADDVHLDMAIVDKDMRREAQQIAKLEEELERLIKLQQRQE